MALKKELRTQTALGKKSGVPQSTIGRIMRSEVDPQSGNLERIAKAFGLSLAELAEMAEEREPVTELSDKLTFLERSTRVALIPWSRVEAYVDVSVSHQLKAEDDWMPRPKYASDRTFALRVRGESMEPSYQHGDIIFVDPNVAPGHGKDVVVRLDDRDDVVFRRLVVDGKLEYLKPANSNWPQKIIEIAAYPSARIVGIVIGKWAEK